MAETTSVFSLTNRSQVAVLIAGVLSFRGGLWTAAAPVITTTPASIVTIAMTTMIDAGVDAVTWR